MISGTQTLFTWSLRSDSRSIIPHIVRAAFAGFMMLAILFAWADSLGGMAPGLTFFIWISGLNVLMISVSGISYFVSAVTEEKDAGTLALLRLAGVSPLTIVLSKSTSRLISAIMLLLIQLPFTFLAVTLGGVTWQQILAAYLALAAWLALVANTALFCSVRCSSSGRAAALASGILILFFAAGPALRSLAGLTVIRLVAFDFQALCEHLHKVQQAMSIVVRLDAIFANASSAATLFSSQFRSNVILSLVLFFLSVLLFNYSSGTEIRSQHGRSARVRRYTVGRCWSYPFTWKDFLFSAGGTPVFVMKSVGYGLLVLAFAWFHSMRHPYSSQFLSADLAAQVFAAVAAVLTFEILLYSSLALLQEHRQSIIGPLRMLPISTPAILVEKTVGYLITLIPAVTTLIILLIGHFQTIVIDNRAIGGLVISWLFFVLLASHLCVLLSLYVRWAALPIAVFLTVIASPCVLSAAVGLTGMTAGAARLTGVPWGAWFGVLVNCVWLWLFVLLPLQLEIVKRWNQLSHQ